MSKQLNDLRNLQVMSEVEADALFAEIAELELWVKKLASERDIQIGLIKSNFEELTREASERLAVLSQRLADYISANQNRFAKPRKRKTPLGSYGLARATKIEILDPEAVKAFSDANNLELYTVSYAINKKAVSDAANKYGEVPGAKVIAGDIASYKVDADNGDHASRETQKRGGKAE